MTRLSKTPSPPRRWAVPIALLGLALGACSEAPAPDAPPTPAPESAAPATPPATPAPAPQSPVTRSPVSRSPVSRSNQEPERTKAAESPISGEALEGGELDWAAGDPAKGAVLYQSQCALCHGAGGQGDGPASAATEPKPRDFTAGDFRFDATENGKAGEPEDLALVIAEGPAAFGGSTLMVAWEDTLSEEEIQDIVAFILGLKSQ